MTDIFMEDDDYNRLLHFILDNSLGTILGDCRDALMIALGEKVGIWPASCRIEENSLLNR